MSVIAASSRGTTNAKDKASFGDKLLLRPFESRADRRPKAVLTKSQKDLFGEPVGIRTRDLLIKSQLLYQLSYRPTQVGCIETSYRVVKGQIPETLAHLAKTAKLG